MSLALRPSDPHSVDSHSVQKKQGLLTVIFWSRKFAPPTLHVCSSTLLKVRAHSPRGIINL